MHYIALVLLCLLGFGLILIGLANRVPTKHTPCDCSGCEILNRPRHLPLKPERTRLAKEGHRV